MIWVGRLLGFGGSHTLHVAVRNFWAVSDMAERQKGRVQVCVRFASFSCITWSWSSIRLLGATCTSTCSGQSECRVQASTQPQNRDGMQEATVSNCFPAPQLVSHLLSHCPGTSRARLWYGLIPQLPLTISYHSVIYRSLSSENN